MNIGRFLRGEDRHVGTARTTMPTKEAPKHPPELLESALSPDEELHFDALYDEEWF